MRQAYIDAYRDHYRTHGKTASGTGECERKMRLWREIGYTDDMTILDYGCGWGAMVACLVRTDRYHGVDIVPEAVALAEATFPGVSFATFEMGKLDCSPADFVAAQSVFTHALREDVADCLRDISRHMMGFALIDVLHGPGADSLLMRYWDRGEWQLQLNQLGLSGSEVAVIEWPAATHTYYRVARERE